ncbi:diaminobutyrate acetyltransferase [Oceanobacillus jordanicus]|uniref:diaminobutyrate acetyltransferase n=1 Tax=Oceanobacillus jordanicus TaxID=2867266 RepID=UPI0030841ABC
MYNQKVNSAASPAEIETNVTFRNPVKKDGAAVWELIKHTGVLDLNSSYSYLMWCDIFSDTSVVAIDGRKVCGFISGYLHPKKTDTLFIWQVAVHESGRGKGLATSMLRNILKRTVCDEVRYIEATVSPSNIASTNLFKGLARDLDTNCLITDYFSSMDFPQDGHEDELLFKIGPTKK